MAGAQAGNNCLILVADTISLTGAAALGNGCSGGSPLQPPVSVSVSPASATLYGGQTQQFTATVVNTTNTAVTWTISPTGTGTIDSSGLYTAPTTISTQQTVTVTATSQASTTASASSTVTLMPKTTPTITWPTPAAITYGTALSGTQLDATASVPGAFVYSPVSGTVLAAGSHTLSVTFTPTNTSEYNTTTSSVPLTVTKAVLTVTANNLSRAYGVANPVLTYTLSGFVNGDTQASATTGAPSLSTTATVSSVVGSYPITAVVGTMAATNYSFTFVNGTLTVGTAAQTITFPNPGNQTYGVVPITLGATASSGLAVSYTVTSGPATVSGSTLTITGAGTVVVTANQAGNAAYTAASAVSATLTISQATLMVTANNLSRAYGVANPVLTYTLSGFVNGDTQASATTGTPSLSTTATVSSVVGSYPITPFVGTLAATNYGFTFVNGALTVGTAAQTITFPNPGNQTYGVAPITLGATASSGLAVSYTVTSGPATVSGSTLTITGAGTVVVTANQAGNMDYSAASASVTFTVNAPVAVAVTPPSAALYGGQTQQYAASVTNTSNTAVTWTISPTGTGTISTAGLYTAPGTISTQQTVTITATSQASVTSTGTALVTLLPAFVNPTLTLAAAAQPPYVTGSSETFVVTLKNQGGTPIPGEAVDIHRHWYEQYYWQRHNRCQWQCLLLLHRSPKRY